MKEVFIVQMNADQTEGRGPMIPVAGFNSYDHALKTVMDPRYKKYCVMGVHSPSNAKYDIRDKPLTVYDTPEEFWLSHDDEEKRKRARAKLTDEEARLLGIK